MMENLKLTHKIARVLTKDYIRGYRDEKMFLPFCEQCPQYGKRWSCPPYGFDTSEYISHYKYVFIIGTKISFDEQLRKSCTSQDESNRITREALEGACRVMAKKHLELEKRYPNSLSFVGARCFLCEPEPCARLSDEPCRHPDEMRHALESIGFDIGKTTQQLLDIELQWGKGGRLPQYTTLVTALFTNCEEVSLEKILLEKSLV